MNRESQAIQINAMHQTMEKKHSFFTDIRKNPVSYLLLLPGLVYVFIFSYCTLPWIIIAFQRYTFQTGLFNSEWVGLKNFEFFFKSTHAARVTINTVTLNLLFITTGLVAAVFFAILFNEIKNKLFSKIAQSTFLFPHFISWVVASFFIFALFQSKGMINQLFIALGIEPVQWYQEPAHWPWIFMLLKLWKGVGIGTVMYLSAIVGFDKELYEAAEIDGCSRGQKIMKITLPLLMPTITILTLMSIGGIFYGDFGMIFSIIKDNGVLLPTTDVIDTYTFRALRKIGDPSNAMAIGLYQSIVGFILVFGSNWIAKKYYSEGALF